MEHHQEINQEEIMLETMIQGQEELITSKVQEFSKVDDEAMAIRYHQEEILALESMNEQAIFQAATSEVTELQEQQQQEQPPQQQARQERQVTALDILLKPSLARIQQLITELTDQNALDLLIAAKLDPEEALRNFFL